MKYDTGLDSQPWLNLLTAMPAGLVFGIQTFFDENAANKVKFTFWQDGTWYLG